MRGPRSGRWGLAFAGVVAIVGVALVAVLLGRGGTPDPLTEPVEAPPTSVGRPSTSVDAQGSDPGPDRGTGGPSALPATPKIMAIGDSISHGLNTGDGMLSYRYQLQDLLRAATCRYDMVGPYNGLASGEVMADADNDHAARSGDASWHSVWELPGWMTTYEPDIALLFIGHNDLYAEVTVKGRPIATVVAETTANVETTIGQLRAGNPGIDIYLAKITPSGLVERDAFVALNDGYAALAARLTTATSPITVVDMYSGFDPAKGVDTHDGVHPNVAGDGKIAQRWYDAMRPALLASNVCGS